MKIDDYPPNVVPLDPARTQKSAAEGPYSFSDIMGKALGETNNAEAVSETAAGDLETDNNTNQLPDLWHQINGLLNTLEDYGESLADPGATLKQISPLMEDIQRQAKLIAAELEKQQGSENLRNLAQQTVAQAQAEMIRFNRGDYV